MTSPVSLISSNYYNGQRHNTMSTLDTSEDYLENARDKLENMMNTTLTPTNLEHKNKKINKLVKNEINVAIEPLLKFRVKLFDDLIKIERDYWNFKQAYSANINILKDNNRNIYTRAFFNLLSLVLK